MQYHASSLCQREDVEEVRLVGYPGSPVHDSLQDAIVSGKLKVDHLPILLPRWVERLPRFLSLPLKATIQLMALLWMLLVMLPRPDVILLQLPPAIPTMMVCRLAATRHHARLVFDWHNFAYTLMAIGMGRQTGLVRVAERHERSWGKSADAALCVTRCMQKELKSRWGIDAAVFQDRPPTFFRRASVEETHNLLERLGPALRTPVHPKDFVSQWLNGIAQRQEEYGMSETICTVQERRHNNLKLGLPSTKKRIDRPAVVVSSTSWTPDEDFGILLRALELYDFKARRDRMLPPLLVFVTGKGPQREQYESKMRNLDLRRVSIRTVWLEPRDYPILLGSSDLGVSLHASSSGMDLPMKVVDMFGCELPVCALSYSCIDELVVHGKNGLLFQTSEELAVQLQETLRGFPGIENSGALHRLRQGIADAGFVKWDEAWCRLAWPVIRGE